MSTLKNHVIIITGAGSGIGRQLAIQAAATGAPVIATDINLNGLAETNRLAGGAVTTRQLDVSDAASIQRFADETIPALGNRPLILVNNAGVALSSGPFATTELDDFEWLLSINLWGVIRMTKAFLPYMTEHNAGHIVNLSSVFGLAGVMNQSAYSTAKFGVRGFSDVLRMELLDTPIKVTCVHPGGIKTAIASSARQGKNTPVTDAMKQNAVSSFEKAARTTPDEAARQIWRGVEQDKARVLIGADARQIEWLTRLLPTRYVQIIRSKIERTFNTEG
ncbi:SDR family NAD(P)-dependent oxidoreductase [Spirosoma rhododendri]|uniref:SDR family NAD(P)-dependent oxidoreductase n=1 Tax=Spirosoma rhododendri TaxID=2728024 RepID=A0A7L5DSM6_9BACT|nr:SDR family NAD(P)-dependent oxidoreductase [Spirosoma rhododendri]QJD80263.1 SDR family NAD(P)-dependent oxidoreductase [Spirosoma rhododendri]